MSQPPRPVRPLSSAAVGGGSWHAQAPAGHIPIGHDPRWLSRPESEACLDSHRSGGAEPPRWARLTLHGLPPGSTHVERTLTAPSTEVTVTLTSGDAPATAAWFQYAPSRVTNPSPTSIEPRTDSVRTRAAVAAGSRSSTEATPAVSRTSRSRRSRPP